jgi:hypothetical protein
VIDGDSGVVARQFDQRVRFEPINAAGVVRSVVSLLPPMNPGRGRSVTISQPAASKPARRRDDDDDFGDDSILQPVRPAQNAADQDWGFAQDILQRPRPGVGYFVVTARGRNANPGQPLTMTWLDTDWGRYLGRPIDRSDGGVDIVYAPADLQRLDETLHRMIHSLT